ncbi:MAG: two-component system sensor histidine kinase ChvG, partial [Alphaproteobacteria bacterium]
MIGRLLSPLTRRILTVNILPLAMLVAGILYLDEYREGLVVAELAALETQAEIFAGALGEGAIGTRPDGAQFILPNVARPMLRRLTAPTRTRARVFAADGAEVADSLFLTGQGGAVQVEALPLPDDSDIPTSAFNGIYDLFVTLLPAGERLPLFPGTVPLRASDLPIAAMALDGDIGTARWSQEGGGMQLGATAPVQRFKQVLGAVLLTANSDDIDAAVRAVRFDILKVFAVVLGLTVMLSLYLASAIARPVRRLAAAADRVRHGHGEADEIPDFTRRRDEIGDLSASLRDMTEALWQRIEANESFAADVAHEIKNPLTSLRSAVETVARVGDPAKQAALMDIIQDDVKRLDRLISDISDASRLDAELARAEMESVDLGRLLPALVQVHEIALAQVDEGGTPDTGTPRLVFRGGDADCAVWGIEGRLVQVFQNLISNARSFTPPGGEISLSVRRDRSDVVVHVDDQGPGIPVDSLDSIFERFYSERPEGESFGRHSGLGLSISRQIIEAHGGAIHAENIHGEQGKRL